MSENFDTLPMGANEFLEDDDDIVTLMTPEGEEVDFVEIAGIAYKGSFYAVLQPVELLEGMDDDEAMVFKVTQKEDGDDSFELELDEDTIDGVFKIYYELLAEQNKKNGYTLDDDGNPI